MRTVWILLTGAILSVAAFSAHSDPLAEERYRAKYGRYTPAAEARQEAARQLTAAMASRVEASVCCQQMKVASRNAAVTESSTDMHFRAKYGRSTPAKEARQRAVAEERAAHTKGRLAIAASGLLCRHECCLDGQ